MTPKTGRNAPCHCGSGKKYKQCHLKLDQAVAKENRAWESAAGFLRRDFIAFAKRSALPNHMRPALPCFSTTTMPLKTPTR